MAHESCSEDGTDGCFLASVHLQMRDADHWEQQYSDVTDEIDCAGDVTCGRIVAASRKEGLPRLEEGQLASRTGSGLGTLRTGVHEKMSTISVLR